MEIPAAAAAAPVRSSLAPAPRWAVWCARLAAVVVLPSAVWRLVMVAGHPAGYTDEGFVAFDTFGAKLWMLTLTVLTELVVLLTLGLVKPWGEVVPRWIPVLGGRRVRPLAAVVPGALGAVALTGIWATIPLWWTHPHDDMTSAGNLIVGLLYQPLVLWGPLTAAVTYSYYARHRAAARSAAHTAG
ncbi:hypothetical protein ACIBI4_18600 [Streptomyces sp. NPDC050418]|uniref:hypothetical protein n=1 Tax=Streptomyces sp. NPDC050418 TaxID=3365612 RepID=UPI0037A81C01